jgi:hypothetical protein
MSVGNGHDLTEQQEEQQRREMEMGAVNTAQTRAQEQAREIRSDLLAETTDTGLSEGQRNILENLVTNDHILAYLREPEIQEVKWDLKIKHELYRAMFPADDCEVTGKDRAFINADQADTMEPLGKDGRMAARTFFDGVWMRVTRARDMQQQKIWQTQIARSEVDNGDDSDSGGLLNRG